MGEYAKREGSRSKMESRLVEGGLAGVLAWGAEAASRAKDAAPVLSGRLVREIKVDPAGPRESPSLVFSILFGVSGLSYARAHEYGSGIHSLDPAYRQLIPIEAGFWTGKSNAKSLAFHWPDGPKDHPAYNAEKDMFFFRKVYHPGVEAANQGKGYLRLGAERSKELGKRLLMEAIIARLKGSV
jgi:hypothetical protein